jgi:alginate O-acetyltransferase complex protein AlgI
MMACAVLVAWPSQAYEWSATISWPKALVVHPLFVVALLAMFAQSFNPFLYFQF